MDDYSEPLALAVSSYTLYNTVWYMVPKVSTAGVQTTHELQHI